MSKYDDDRENVRRAHAWIDGVRESLPQLKRLIADDREEGLDLARRVIAEATNFHDIIMSNECNEPLYLELLAEYSRLIDEVRDLI